MAINCCSSTGVLAAVLVSLLLLPSPELLSPSPAPPSPADLAAAPTILLDQWLSIDLLVAAGLLLYVSTVYVTEWGQRKFMERRMAKLNAYLFSSVEKLVTWDVQQEQLETTLKLVQEATSEYNLLLYLLLRQHRCLAVHPDHNEYLDGDWDKLDNVLYSRDPRLES